MFEFKKNNNINELKELLKKYKYLTSDFFDSPDRTYIFLENDIIKFVDFGDIISNFNINIYNNIVFREVKRKYENINY